MSTKCRRLCLDWISHDPRMSAFAVRDPCAPLPESHSTTFPALGATLIAKMLSERSSPETNASIVRLQGFWWGRMVCNTLVPLLGGRSASADRSFTRP